MPFLAESTSGVFMQTLLLLLILVKLYKQAEGVKSQTQLCKGKERRFASEQMQQFEEGEVTSLYWLGPKISQMMPVNKTVVI